MLMLFSWIRYFTGNASVSSSTIIFRKKVDTNKARIVVITNKILIFLGRKEISFKMCKETNMKMNMKNKNNRVDMIRLLPKKSKDVRLLAEMMSAIV